MVALVPVHGTHVPISAPWASVAGVVAPALGGLGRVRRHVVLGAARVRWGNDAWPVNNRVGRRMLRANRAGLRSEPAAAEAAATARQLDRLGYAVLDPGYPPALLRAVQLGYEKVIDQPEHTLDMGRRRPDVVRYVRDPVRHVPELRRLLTPEITAVLDAFYGGRWQLEHVRMWRIGHLPPAERVHQQYGNLWHCDHHPVSTLKLFVQIDDGVTAEGGAFRFHDVPSTRRIMRGGFLSDERIIGAARGRVEDPRRVIAFDAPAGHVAFCNTTRCLHRAGVPAPGTTRGMVQLTFGAAETAAAPDPFAVLPPDPSVIPGNTV